MDDPRSYNGANQRLGNAEYWLARAREKRPVDQGEVDKWQRRVDVWRQEVETITRVLEGKV